MGKTSLLVQFDQGKFIPGSFSATVGIGFTVRAQSLVPGLCNLAHPWGSRFIQVIIIDDSMILSGAKHKELGEFSLVMLDEGPCLAMCLLASWGQVHFRLLGGGGLRTDKASRPKTLSGAVPERSLLHRTQKAAFGVALLSRGEASLCSASAAWSPREKSGRWQQRLGKALGCHPALFAELPWGWRAAPMHVSPLPGELGTETALGTSPHSRTGIPPASVARLGLSRRLLPTGWLLPMRRLLATRVFSLVQAKEAGKHAVLVQGVWGQAAQGLAAEGAPSGIAKPWAGRGGSATLPTFASSWLPCFS